MSADLPLYPAPGDDVRRGRAAPSGSRKILLIEDDPAAAEYITQGFRQKGYLVEHARDGRDGLFHALEGTYSVVILDRMLPQLDGLSVLSALRSAGVNTPVIILSAIGSTSERVKGLRSGADDYLTKPFAFSELLARVEALQRRRSPHDAGAATMLTCADLRLDLLSHRVERAGQRIDLQPREFRLLAFLMANRNQVVTRTMMLEEVWDYHFDPRTNVIDALVSRVRKKIDLPGLKPLLKTMRGAGYMLTDQD